MEKAAESSAPSLIYRESDLVIRTIRDYFTADIEEVLVDSKEVYKQAKAFFKEIMPRHEKTVKLHQEKRPIFSKYQLEEQIDLIYEKKVPLKSGGSIVIDPTEALVSIDVNSGKSTGERGVEDTAFKTNLEAAEEAARQLRLRDLGGLIVIDFIDMRDRKHQTEVEKTLKNALKADKARVSVGKISQFGLLEMSRQRIKQTINEGSYLECPHCGGHGKVKSVETMVLSFLRRVHAAAARGNITEVRGGLPLEVAYYLLNRKKRELTQIENEYAIEVTVKGKPSFMMNQMELELVKKEKEPSLEPEPEHAAGEPAVEAGIEKESPETPETVEENKESRSKRKRRRHKKKPQALQEPATETLAAVEEAPLDEIPETALLPVPESPEAGREEAKADNEPHQKKKRRRRRKRGTRPALAEEATQMTAEATADIAVGKDEFPPFIAEEPVPVTEAAEPKAKRKRKPRKKTPAEAAVSKESPDEQGNIGAEEGASFVEYKSGITEPGIQNEMETKPKRSRPRKKKEPVPEPEA
jgi:ribonuclease E